MKNIENLLTLIIDPQHNSRSQLRMILEPIGLKKFVYANNANQAVKAIRENTFHLVFCEYHLAEQQTGQQLLEDLRNHQVLPRHTAFIIITGESRAQHVIGAAELIPDDFVLKPFSPNEMLQRVQNCLSKKQFLAKLLTAMDQADFAGVLKEARRLSTNSSSLQSEIFRLQIDALLAMGHPKEAATILAQSRKVREFAWLDLYQAKIDLASGNIEVATAALKLLLANNPNFIGAYEWLAKAHVQEQNYPGAAAVLEEAQRLSPLRVNRLRILANVYEKQGDYSNACNYLESTIAQTRYSEFSRPEDHLQLMSCQLQGDKPEAAATTFAALQAVVAKKPESADCLIYAEAIQARHQNNEEEALRLLATVTPPAKTNWSHEAFSSTMLASNIYHSISDTESETVSQKSSQKSAAQKQRLLKKVSTEAVAAMEVFADKYPDQRIHKLARKVYELSNFGWKEKLATTVFRLLDVLSKDPQLGAQIQELQKDLFRAQEKFGIQAKRSNTPTTKMAGTGSRAATSHNTQ